MSVSSVVRVGSVVGFVVLFAFVVSLALVV